MQVQRDFIWDFRIFLQLKNYSQRTIKCYTTCLRQFFTKTQSQSSKIENDIVQNFILALYQKNYSPKTVNLYYNAIKSYSENIISQKLTLELKKCRYPRRLPNILSHLEVEKIITKTTNLKHKTIISLAYGSGLRVSEVVNILVRDIDFDRWVINIRLAKWQKDRITLLPKKILPALRKICTQKNRTDWLFANTLWQKLSTRTCQKIFHNACIKASITKDVSFHSLRHSFATHLLENGLDVTYVQKLLWHANIKTTQTYLHIANTNLKNIESPLDIIARK